MLAYDFMVCEFSALYDSNGVTLHMMHFITMIHMAMIHMPMEMPTAMHMEIMHMAVTHMDMTLMGIHMAMILTAMHMATCTVINMVLTMDFPTVKMALLAIIPK